jgi:hypothetical protein
MKETEEQMGEKERKDDRRLKPSPFHASMTCSLVQEKLIYIHVCISSFTRRLC